MPTPRWKLADDQSLEDYSLGDDAASLGEFFATAITDGTGVFNSSRTVKYDKFRKTFWEEPIYNPEINHGHLSDHVYEYLDKEQKKAWNHSGHKWSLSSDVRFRDNAYENPGPQKPERFPQCFEMPSKYWGRERKINPYARAKVYTRPNDRCKPWAKLTLLEEMADLGPGRYDIPDEWAKATKPVCGVVRPSSFMTSKSKKGCPIKVAEGQVGYEISTTEAEGDMPMKDIAQSRSAPRTAAKHFSAPTYSAKRLSTGYTFSRGEKNAMDKGMSADSAVYNIRVRNARTGEPCIVQVNSLSSPPPDGYVNVETWANECLDGGSSLTLKKEPLPPLNPLAHDIDLSVPDVALVPVPVTPLKKSKPCSPVRVKQMHLTSGTDVLYINSDSTSPVERTNGFYLPAATHSLQSTKGSAQQSMYDLNPSEYDSAGVVDWNHPIAQLHIPTPGPHRSNTVSATAHRSKTKGQQLLERERKERPRGRESDEAFSIITNRSRPNGAKFKKIPMHIADVASIAPSTIAEVPSFHKSGSLYEDSLGAKNVTKKDKDSIILEASQNISTLLNSMSESQFLLMAKAK